MADFDPSAQHFGRESELCALVQDLLPLYIEDEVRSESRALIVAHLNECAHCAGFLAGARTVREQLRREREQEAGQMPRWGSVQVLLNAGVQIIGALCLAMFVSLAAIVGFHVMMRSVSSVWAGIGVGVSATELFMLAGLLVLAGLSFLLMRREQPNPRMAGLVAASALVLGVAGMVQPYLGPAYHAMGVVLVLGGFAAIWRLRHELAAWRFGDIWKFGIGMFCIAVGVVALLATRPVSTVEFSVVPVIAPTAVPAAWPAAVEMPVEVVSPLSLDIQAAQQMPTVPPPYQLATPTPIPYQP